MKILVFSDTHGITSFMENGIDSHLKNGGIDMLVHLGDGTRDFLTAIKKYPDIPAVYVAGNQEEFTSSYMDVSKLNYTASFTAGGIKFMAVHGHKLHVKSNLQFAADYAIKNGADVLLYGHTHEKADMTIDGTDGGCIRMINPGSAGPWYNSSYALLNIYDGQLVCGFAERTI